MIKDFRTFINEDLFHGSVKREYSGDTRKEDGVKVHTCIGVDMILHDPNLEWEGMKYDDFIKELLENDDEYDSMHVDIAHSNELKLSPEEMANVRNFKAPYGYLIYDGKYGTDLVASFDSYYDMIKSYNEQFPKCVDEHDYISICRCVATKLKEVGGHIEYIPNNRDSWILGDNNSCGGDYFLRLIKDKDTWSWECEQDKEDLNNYLERFKKEMVLKFPEIENEDFIIWSPSNGYYITLNITVNNLNNFQKYLDYTQKWFEV